MQAFLIQILINLAIAAAMAVISMALMPRKETEPPKPQKNDMEPTADEGTEVKHLFGTGPVEMGIVAVMDRRVEAIVRP